MHHVLFDRIGLLGQRHFTGDLFGLCGLRSHLTPPWISCPAHFGLPTGKVHRFAPLRHRKPVGFDAKMGMMASIPNTPPGNEMPHIEIRDVSLFLTLRPDRSPGSKTPASTSSNPSSSASSVPPAAASPRCSTSSRASSSPPAAYLNRRQGGERLRQDRGVVFQDFAQLFPGARRWATSPSGWR